MTAALLRCAAALGASCSLGGGRGGGGRRQSGVRRCTALVSCQWSVVMVTGAALSPVCPQHHCTTGEWCQSSSSPFSGIKYLHSGRQLTVCDAGFDGSPRPSGGDGRSAVAVSAACQPSELGWTTLSRQATGIGWIVCRKTTVPVLKTKTVCVVPMYGRYVGGRIIGTRDIPRTSSVGMAFTVRNSGAADDTEPGQP